MEGVIETLLKSSLNSDVKSTVLKFLLEEAKEKFTAVTSDSLSDKIESLEATKSLLDMEIDLLKEKEFLEDIHKLCVDNKLAFWREKPFLPFETAISSNICGPIKASLLAETSMELLKFIDKKHEFLSNKNLIIKYDKLEERTYMKFQFVSDREMVDLDLKDKYFYLDNSISYSGKKHHLIFGFWVEDKLLEAYCDHQKRVNKNWLIDVRAAISRASSLVDSLEERNGDSE